MIVQPETPNKVTTMLWPIPRQYPDIVIPDNWETLEDFVKWYMETQKPMLVPFDAKTIRTDDATAICIFKKGQYQVELYLIHPNQVIPIHSHPGMEVITVTVGGGSICGPEGTLGTSMNSGTTSPKLLEGEYHGGKPTGDGDGFLLLSFEKWLRGIRPTSAALQWRGPTAGPIHDALLSKYSPGAIISPGLADITLSQINSK